MDDEAKFWFRCLVAILLAVVLAVLGGVFINCWHMHRMAELGYEERIVPGRQSTLWQKLPQPPSPQPMLTPPSYSIVPCSSNIEAYVTTNSFVIGGGKMGRIEWFEELK